MLRRHGIRVAIVAAIGFGLAGCSGSDNEDSAGNAGSGVDPANVGTVASDGFVSQVKSVIGASSDTAEPASTDGVTGTLSEDAEPETAGS